jgi:heme/copper-type cytochrome/quinol oxidase subunit 2
MRLVQLRNYLLPAMLLAGGGLVGFLVARAGLASPQERTLTITAHKYGYDPSVLRVNRGDRVRIRLVAKDVTHGFYLEGYDLDAKMRPENDTFWLRRPSAEEGYQEVEQINFVASHTGKFRYRCSTTCGYMHPFMQGELIVSPNYLFSTSVGLSAGLAAGMLLIFRRSATGGGS